jgi:glucuronokinase
MKFWADLTVKFRKALEEGNLPEMHRLMNANCDKRAALYDIGPGNREMMAIARSVGASAKFAGSGGAIVGLYDSEEMFQKLEKAFAKKGIRVIKPNYAPPIEASKVLPVR